MNLLLNKCFLLIWIIYSSCIHSFDHIFIILPTTFREDYEMITVISDAYKQCRVLRVTNNTKTFLVKTNLLVITVFEVRPLDLLLEDFQSSPV